MLQKKLIIVKKHIINLRAEKSNEHYTHVRDEILRKATVNMDKVFGSSEQG